MADEELDRARAELAKVMGPIGENSAETRRQAAVLLGAKEPAAAVGEKSIGDQVLNAYMDDRYGKSHPVQTFLRDTRSGVEDLAAKADRIETKLDQLIALLAGDGK